MLSLSQRNHISIYGSVATLAIMLLSFTVGRAQSTNGVNTTGTYGNEEIRGTIHFPGGRKPSLQPIVKLQSDTSSGELKALPGSDGSFGFTRLRSDSYTIIVEGGDDFENAREHVQVGNPGPVPAQGDPFGYAHPLVYRVEIYLQPKRATALTANAETVRAAQLAKQSPSTRDLFQKAMTSAQHGESAKSVELLESAIQQSPNFELAYTELGLQYLKLGKANKAADSFTAALKLDADDVEARLNYGFALVSLTKFAEAEEQLQMALKKDPASAIGHYYLALALMNRQQFEAAEIEFKTSISKSSDAIAPAHKYLGGIYWRKKQYRPAADELERYLKLEPEAADAAKIRDTIKDLRARS